MKLYEWHRIDDVSLSTMEENKIMEITVAAKKIGLLKRNETIYAFAATCPHAGTPLCEGWLDMRGYIVCPNHKYRFDPANGRNVSCEGYKLFTYPVEIKYDGIYVGFIMQV